MPEEHMRKSCLMASTASLALLALLGAAHAQPANSILSVTSRPGEGPVATVVEIRSQAPANFTSFKLLAPARLVLDFSECSLGDLKENIPVNDAATESISLSQHGTGAAMLSRVVINLREDLEYTIDAKEALLVVNILRGKGTQDRPPPAQAEPANPPVAEQTVAPVTEPVQAPTVEQAVAPKTETTQPPAVEQSVQPVTEPVQQVVQEQPPAAAPASAAEPAPTPPPAVAMAEGKPPESAPATVPAAQPEPPPPASPPPAQEPAAAPAPAPAAQATPPQVQEPAPAAQPEPPAPTPVAPVEPAPAPAPVAQPEPPPPAPAPAAQPEPQQPAPAPAPVAAQEAPPPAPAAAPVPEPAATQAAPLTKPVTITAPEQEQSVVDLAEMAAKSGPAAAPPDASAAGDKTAAAVPEKKKPYKVYKGGKKAVTWVGFQQSKGSSRVFVKTSAPVEYNISQDGRSILLALPNTFIPQGVFRRAIDTSYFATAIDSIVPKVDRRSDTTTFEIKLREMVQHTAKQEDNAINIDFAVPANVKPKEMPILAPRSKRADGEKAAEQPQEKPGDQAKLPLQAPAAAPAQAPSQPAPAPSGDSPMGKQK
jgi:hypothetical protein